ncbi:PQQ-binding-like beta-propeller repeat protein [Gemmata sp. JC673]|uniref:PQQ-binding-like beta-propeller repeat protein n=1 Tax=Gemmata algarum TaxID=2975278 RepID=A0ABU5EQT7_9BACT|nr:PQQ-binding-like beta-propeller repeat protein [Gemmata algarum]MDY3557540.1 PQQ-binding-like beta-propeller repeat protein [Gemmata algarum]
MLPPLSRLFGLLALLALASSGTARAADWVHWRGPAQNGHSLEKGLPADFDPALKDKGNVVWSAPFGGRSAPLVMGGRVYVIQGFGEGLSESERIVCLDEKSGKKLWEHVERIYHSDVVSSRLGWTPLTADPATGYVYANTTAGNLVCLDKNGKEVWERQLTEEFGRFTGYGGRVSAPTFDSGLVIIGIINSSWGDLARGSNRYYAFDAKNGNVVWIADTGPPKSTYQSNPVVAVIGGQRLLITGGGDGALHAFKVRTGELVWSYVFSGGAVNPSPIVDGNLVYCAHGEENPGGGVIGKVICVDASQIDPATKRPKSVWEYSKGQRFGLSSPALADGVLYVPEDSGELFAFDAKTGKLLWKYRYATEVRGAPLVADGKIYIFDVKGRLNIIKLNGRKAPDEDETFVYIFKESINGRPVQTETNGTPIAVNGRVYFTSRTDLFCLGDTGSKPAAAKYPAPPAEASSDGKVAGARLYPAEITLTPGGTYKFSVVYFDANGRELKAAPGAPVEWTLPLPDKTPTGAQPPALIGKVTGTPTEGALELGPNPAQQGVVSFKAGAVTARARVRVAPKLPARTDFDKAPDGSSPGGWINTNAKFAVKKLPDGNQVLSKVNDKAPPPLAKAIGYITVPTASDYTIQADLMGSEVRGKLPDGGIVNSRYSLVLDGKPDAKLQKRTIRLTSWEARERINIGVPFDWQPGTWYTLKLAIELKPRAAVLRGKVWKKGEPEPEKWTIEFEDPHPNRDGAAGLYGYIPNVLDSGGKTEPGSELYFDNLSITPNNKGGK